MARFPVVLFSPGGGLKALTYHVFLEDLASHGWIVAALDPPYNPRAMRMPDGRVLGNLKPEERGWP
jgi:predicted dienelactone hydrolase